MVRIGDARAATLPLVGADRVVVRRLMHGIDAHKSLLADWKTLSASSMHVPTTFAVAPTD